VGVGVGALQRRRLKIYFSQKKDMIGYRKVSVQEKSYPTPPLPLYLFQEIEKSNSTLQAERIAFDQIAHKMKLNLRLMRHYDVIDGAMQEKNMVPAADDWKPTLEVDERDTVEKFKRRIAAEFPNGINCFLLLTRLY
jgi:hypothetical protein